MKKVFHVFRSEPVPKAAEGANGRRRFMPRGLLLAFLASLVLCFALPVHAQIVARVTCAGVAAAFRVQASCRPSCDGEIDVTNLVRSGAPAVQQIDLNQINLCDTGVCCVTPGDNVCSEPADLFDVTASCRGTCGAGETDISARLAGGTIPICSGPSLCCAPSSQVDRYFGTGSPPPVNRTKAIAVIGRMMAAQPSSATSSKPTAGGAGAVALPDPLSGANFPQLVGNAIRTIMGISGSIALLMFVFGGIQYIMSGGDPKKVSAAMTYIKNASFGLILIFGAYAISSVIFDALLTTQ